MVSTRSRGGAPLPAPRGRRRRARGNQVITRRKEYGPNDAAHRHRLHDDQEKTVGVRTHQRRNP